MKDFEEIGQLYEIAPWYLVGTSQHRSISTYCDAERYIKGRWKESKRYIRETPTYGSLWRTDVSAILGARLREITGADKLNNTNISKMENYNLERFLDGQRFGYDCALTRLDAVGFVIFLWELEVYLHSTRILVGT